eukprot:5616749-Prymnesium_polylepis.1
MVFGSSLAERKGGPGPGEYTPRLPGNVPEAQTFANGSSGWPMQWPMVRRGAVAGATRALRCRVWHE